MSFIRALAVSNPCMGRQIAFESPTIQLINRACSTGKTEAFAVTTECWTLSRIESTAQI